MNNRIETAYLEDAHDRAEDLFLSDQRSLRDVGKDRRRVERSLGEGVIARRNEATRENLGPLGDGVVD